MILNFDEAAEIANILWHTNRPKFVRECAVARAEGITLLELIAERIADRMVPSYAEFDCQPLTAEVRQ